MVSRGYQTPVAVRSNWITIQPNRVIGVGWVAILLVAVLLTAQTSAYILQNGLIADRPPLSLLQTAIRIALGAGAMALWFVRRDALERTALASAIIAASSSALFGFGLRSPLLASLRLLSHLAMYALAAIVAWRVVMATRREMIPSSRP
jgi:hypothetical protein